jgi:hypothetical protein
MRAKIDFIDHPFEAYSEAIGGRTFVVNLKAQD